MAEYEIRRVANDATLADAHDVRRTVFVEEQGVPEPVEMDDEDGAARHVVAYDGESPVGTARLREPEPKLAKIERVAVRPSHRGAGLGRELLYALEDLARRDRMDEAVVHAQTRVEGFYRTLGYETVSDVFEEAEIPHVEMRKPLGRDSWTC